jgi:putative SOS response-associated peptidase YedK
MCKAFSLASEGDILKEHFGLDERPGFRAEGVLTPERSCQVVVEEDGRRRIKLLSWGFVPAHARGAGLRPVNARSESAADKPAFEVAFIRRRCLVPTTGFIEGRYVARGQKEPMIIRMKHRGLFALGGIWDRWEGREPPLLSFALLTTEPNSVVAPIHCRMPVIVAPEDYDAWLDPATPLAEIERMTRPFSPTGMEAVPADL